MGWDKSASFRGVVGDVRRFYVVSMHPCFVWQIYMLENRNL